MLRIFFKLKLFLVPLFLAYSYFLLIASPYFFSKITPFSVLGVLSAIEEKQTDFNLLPSKNRVTDRFDNHIFAGEKVIAKVNATENNLGIVLIRFERFGIVSDKVIFRIKEEGKKGWHYEHTYRADQFFDNQYFTFGFPPIVSSKDRNYVLEIESMSGRYNNGIGISLDKPSIAFVYKYSRDDLTNYNILYSFISKKSIYVADNINWLEHRHILYLFILIFIYITFRNKINKAVFGIVRFPSHLKKESKKILRVVEKKIADFIKQTIRVFTSTKFYQTFLNSDTKKRVAITLLIFLFAYIYRFSNSLVNQQNIFYAGLGGGGDYDQFIRASTCALNFCSWILHQNLFIESLILGTFYEIFGFAGGLRSYLHLMFLLSSIVAVLPYVLLSRKNWLTIGGIIGGTFLAGSDFLTRVAISFPPDNLSLFTFSIFYIVYLFTLHVRTIRWLMILGLAGLFDGLTKALFLINDLVVLGFFAPVFFYEKVISHGKVSSSLRENIQFAFKKNNFKILFLACIPLIVFAVGYISWEVLVYIRFEAGYFLRGLVESRGESFVSYTSFNDRSLTGDIVFQLFFILVSIIIMLKRLIEHSGLQLIFLAPIFLGLLYVTFIRKNGKNLPFKKLVFVIVFSAAFIGLLVLTKNNYLGINDVLGDYIFAWSNITFVNVFLFVEIILLFILNFKYSALKQTLPILPYAIMLVILTKNSPFARLHTHVLVFTIVLLAYLVDFILENTYMYSKRKIIVFESVLLILFMFLYTLPKTMIMMPRLNSGISMVRDQAVYLKWVEDNIPENAVVLAGGESDLVSVASSINRRIIFSTLWTGAMLIEPDEIPGIKPTDFALIKIMKIKNVGEIRSNDFNIVGELKNKNNFKKNKYIILEDDIYLWRGRLNGVADGVFTADLNITYELHGSDYSVKVYKYNPTLKKAVYELNIRDASIN